MAKNETNTHPSGALIDGRYTLRVRDKHQAASMKKIKAHRNSQAVFDEETGGYIVTWDPDPQFAEG